MSAWFKSSFSYPLLIFCFGLTSALVYFYDKSSQEIKTIHYQILQLEEQLTQLKEENEYLTKALSQEKNILKEKKLLKERYAKNNELIVNLQVPTLKNKIDALPNQKKFIPQQYDRWLKNILIFLLIFGVAFLLYNSNMLITKKK